MCCRYRIQLILKRQDLRHYGYQSKGCNLTVDCLPSMHVALGSAHNTEKKCQILQMTCKNINISDVLPVAHSHA